MFIGTRALNKVNIFYHFPEDASKNTFSSQDLHVTKVWRAPTSKNLSLSCMHLVDVQNNAKKSHRLNDKVTCHIRRSIWVVYVQGKGYLKKKKGEKGSIQVCAMFLCVVKLDRKSANSQDILWSWRNPGLKSVQKRFSHLSWHDSVFRSLFFLFRRFFTLLQSTCERTRSHMHQWGSQHDPVFGQLALGCFVATLRHRWFAWECDRCTEMKENKHSNTV